MALSPSTGCGDRHFRREPAKLRNDTRRGLSRVLETSQSYTQREPPSKCVQIIRQTRVRQGPSQCPVAQWASRILGPRGQVRCSWTADRQGDPSDDAGAQLSPRPLAGSGSRGRLRARWAPYHPRATDAGAGQAARRVETDRGSDQLDARCRGGRGLARTSMPTVVRASATGTMGPWSPTSRCRSWWCWRLGLLTWQFFWFEEMHCSTQIRTRGT